MKFKVIDGEGLSSAGFEADVHIRAEELHVDVTIPERYQLVRDLLDAEDDLRAAKLQIAAWEAQVEVYQKRVTRIQTWLGEDNAETDEA